MKLALVAIFLVAIWRIFHHSQGFSRFLECYRDQKDLLPKKVVFDSVLEQFQELVIKISIWLGIASVCFFALYWNLFN